MFAPFFAALFYSLAIVSAWSATARAATITLKPFTVAGATNVTVNAINDLGIAVGTYQDGTGRAVGFYGRLGETLELPPPSKGVTPVPTAINDSAAIVGIYDATGDSFGFVWQAGRYVDFFSLGQVGRTQYWPFISEAGTISYDFYQGSGAYIPYAGTIWSQIQLPIGFMPLVASISNGGRAAGVFHPFIGGKAEPAVFTISAGAVAIIIPPSAIAAYGGFINNQGSVAGSYVDASGHAHGFLFAGGSYKSFDPAKNIDSLEVQGIDAAGRVVGTLVTGAVQSAFIQHGNASSAFGSWPVSDILHVSISERGFHIAVSVSQNGSQEASFLARCEGAGC